VYYYSSSWCPISGGLGSISDAVGSALQTLSARAVGDSELTPFPRVVPAPADVLPEQDVPRGPSFEYNGGPVNPVPMPGAGPEPMKQRPATVPLEGRSVSAPPRTPRPAHPAYGEPVRMPAVEGKVFLTGSPRPSNVVR